MHEHSRARAADLSVVIPIHNSTLVLGRTIERWLDRQKHGLTEFILVENGSHDLTWALANDLAKDTAHVRFVLDQSEKGMGNALRKGIALSTGRRVLLSADDLPFDFGDIEEAEKLDHEPTIVIGSKAHPHSDVTRERKRHVYTYGYRMFRKVLLGSRVGDSQGTIIADGEWLRANVENFDEPGFLFTTQLILAAEVQGVDIREVPVVLSADHAPKPSTVRAGDVWDMGFGLLRLRGKRRTLAVRALAQVPA
jgi:glycosyltransferase involved in cell wall biosynthesis